MSCSKSTTLCFRSAGCRRFQRNLARRYNSYVPGSTRTFRESDLFLSGVSSARSSCAMLRAISSWTDNTSRSELNADVQTREASEARQEKQGTTQGAVSAILAQLPNPPSFYCSGLFCFFVYLPNHILQLFAKRGELEVFQSRFRTHKRSCQWKNVWNM